MLHIKLLGDMKLWTDDGLVQGISEKGMALLAFLFISS